MPDLDHALSDSVALSRLRRLKHLHLRVQEKNTAIIQQLPRYLPNTLEEMTIQTDLQLRTYKVGSLALPINGSSYHLLTPPNLADLTSADRLNHPRQSAWIVHQSGPGWEFVQIQPLRVSLQHGFFPYRSMLTAWPCLAMKAMLCPLTSSYACCCCVFCIFHLGTWSSLIDPDLRWPFAAGESTAIGRIRLDPCPPESCPIIWSAMEDRPGHIVWLGC